MTDPTHPAAEYARLQADARRRVDDLDGRLRRVGRLRLATFVTGVAVAWLALDRAAIPPAWCLLPVAVFAGLVVFYESVRARRDLEARREKFFALGLARLERRWPDLPDAPSPAAAEATTAAEIEVFGATSLFRLLDTTCTTDGRATLGRWLVESPTAEEIRARQAGVAELAGDLAPRLDLYTAGSAIDRPTELERLASWAREARPPMPILLPVVGIVAPIATTTAVFLAIGGGTSTLAYVALVFHALVLAAARGPIEKAVRGADRAARALSAFGGMVACVEGHSPESPRLSALRDQVLTPTPASDQIRALGRRLDLHDSARNLFFLPAALLLCWPIHTAFGIDRWRRTHGDRIPRWLRAVAEWEVLAALANHRAEHPDNTFPDVTVGPAHFRGEGLRHPLLAPAEAIANDVALGGDLPAWMVSGSNMSGKSTLLRTVGLNARLAQAGATVHARSLSQSALWVGAAMRPLDSVTDGRSRFQAEIERIKEIFGQTQQTPTVLFLLDEIFSGTNSHDRRLGAAAIIRALIDAGAIGLVTTHDLALTEIAAQPGAGLRNVHFEDHLEGGTMSFDYRLKDGVVRKSNAIALMQAVGLPVREPTDGSPGAVLEDRPPRREPPTRG